MINHEHHQHGEAEHICDGECAEAHLAHGIMHAAELLPEGIPAEAALAVYTQLNDALHQDVHSTTPRRTLLTIGQAGRNKNITLSDLSRPEIAIQLLGIRSGMPVVIKAMRENFRSKEMQEAIIPAFIYQGTDGTVRLTYDTYSFFVGKDWVVPQEVATQLVDIFRKIKSALRPDLAGNDHSSVAKGKGTTPQELSDHIPIVTTQFGTLINSVAAPTDEILSKVQAQALVLGAQMSDTSHLLHNSGQRNGHGKVLSLPQKIEAVQKARGLRLAADLPLAKYRQDAPSVGIFCLPNIDFAHHLVPLLEQVPTPAQALLRRKLSPSLPDLIIPLEFVNNEIITGGSGVQARRAEGLGVDPDKVLYRLETAITDNHHVVTATADAYGDRKLKRSKKY